MPRHKKQPESEQAAGAPEWMVTFSDCMTLLLTFFVLLLSFSSFDDLDLQKINSSFADQFSFSKPEDSEKDAISTIPKPDQDLHWGSEKPTLSEGLEDWFKKQSQPADFIRLNTFLISSNEIFWGNGIVISTNGREVLTDLSLFLKELPDYMVIISESGPQDNNRPPNIAFERAWAVLDYMAAEKGIERRQLNISATGTAVKEYHANNLRQTNASDDNRILEIVLLKRSL